MNTYATLFLAVIITTTYINPVNTSGVYDYSRTSVAHTYSNGTTSIQPINASGVATSNTYWLRAPNIHLSTPTYHFTPPTK